MSLCGPTNALNKLSQHSQVDRSLHQAQSQRRFQSSGVDAFKSSQHNQQLELEFQQQQRQFQQGFNPIFANAFGATPLQRQSPQPQQQHQAPVGQSSWANDFTTSNKFTQSSNHQYKSTTSWNDQFQSSFQHHQQTNAPSFTPTIATPRSFTNLQQLSNLNMTQASLQTSQQHFRTEHEELHHQQMDVFNKELESEFNKLEQEFQNTSLKDSEPQIFKAPNSDFANAAMQVVNAMNTQNSEKFKQSKFLSLMNMVSQGKVELNEDETKLVDHESGEDINELQQQQQSRLPDPLEGISVGELETPFQSAQLVAENHDEKYTWDDVYLDYKHDDSSF